MFLVWLLQDASAVSRPAMGPKAVHLNFAQIELKAAEPPPNRLVELEPPPEPAEVALEEILTPPEPVAVQAVDQVEQEAVAPDVAIEAPDTLTGDTQVIDWRGIAGAKVNALVEKEKYYPAIAQKNGYTGWYQVKIHLAPTGMITQYEIEDQHGHPLLTRAVQKTLGEIQGRRIDMTLPTDLVVGVTIEFKNE